MAARPHVKIMHILVPIDGSDASFRALRTGARMVTGAGIDLSVVHFSDEETDATDSIVERAREILDEMGVDADPEVAVDIELEFRPGDRVGDDILDLVEARDIDHVVMGYPESSTVERVILGSATETVLESRRVPVTVVP